MARQIFGTQNPNQDALNRQLGVEGPPVYNPSEPAFQDARRRPGETREDILLRTGRPIPGTPGVPDNATPSMSAQTNGQGVPPPPPPAAVAPPPLAALSGFNADKLNNPDHQTPKYVVGRLMAQHDPRTPEGREAIARGIEAAFPGAKQVSVDSFDIPGVGIVDIYGNASGGDFTPQWIPDAENTPGPPTAGGGAAAPMLATPGLNGLLSGDALTRIQEAIGKINDKGQVNLQALLGNLQGV